MNDFRCEVCGSARLCYEECLNCRIEVVIHDNSHIEYVGPVIDDVMELKNNGCFCCKGCGNELYHDGKRVNNEKILKLYLSEYNNNSGAENN